MFQKVLVPVEGSEASMKAAEAARQLLEQGVTNEVSLIHVVQATDVVPMNGPNIALDYPLLFQELNDLAHQTLRDAQAILGDQQSVTLLLEAGPPAEIICNIARKQKCDLIIIGNRGLNRFQRVLLGSISSKVIVQAHCPVLIVK
ncbi:MAG: universal stress protein [Syntrophomonadaceae bacterium]|nr:universal stress protein [Syntrophomonadaceae bacterium]